MRVVVGYPPLFASIAARFHIDKRDVIFAWGDTIYNPGNIPITPDLMAHEQVHGTRQAGDVAGWWKRYIEDDAFRLAEEIPAHVAELRVLLEHHGSSRPWRRRLVPYVASRLASPLYGRLISPAEAQRVLRAALEEA